MKKTFKAVYGACLGNHKKWLPIATDFILRSAKKKERAAIAYAIFQKGRDPSLLAKIIKSSSYKKNPAKAGKLKVMHRDLIIENVSLLEPIDALDILNRYDLCTPLRSAVLSRLHSLDISNDETLEVVLSHVKGEHTLTRLIKKRYIANNPLRSWSRENWHKVISADSYIARLQENKGYERKYLETLQSALLYMLKNKEKFLADIESFNTIISFMIEALKLKENRTVSKENSLEQAILLMVSTTNKRSWTDVAESRNKVRILDKLSKIDTNLFKEVAKHQFDADTIQKMMRSLHKRRGSADGRKVYISWISGQIEGLTKETNESRAICSNAADWLKRHTSRNVSYPQRDLLFALKALLENPNTQEKIGVFLQFERLIKNMWLRPAGDRIEIVECSREKAKLLSTYIYSHPITSIKDIKATVESIAKKHPESVPMIAEAFEIIQYPKKQKDLIYIYPKNMNLRQIYSSSVTGQEVAV